MNTFIMATWEEYKLYFSKIVLNGFRQTNLIPFQIMDNFKADEGSHINSVQAFSIKKS